MAEEPNAAETAPQPDASGDTPVTASAPPPVPIKVGCAWLTVPKLASLELSAGHVWINDSQRDFTEGQKLVLRIPRKSVKRSEVTTTTAPRGATKALTDACATYVSPQVLEALGGAGFTPEVRRYRLLDRVRKLWSIDGLLVALPAVAGAVGAWATAWGVLMSQPADLNADRIQAVLSWAAEPLATLPARPDPIASAAAATEFENRSVRANACVQSLQGHYGPSPQIPQITCVPATKSWVQRHGGLVAALASGAVALVGLVTMWRRTRFQQTP